MHNKNFAENFPSERYYLHVIYCFTSQSPPITYSLNIHSLYSLPFNSSSHFNNHSIYHSTITQYSVYYYYTQYSFTLLTILIHLFIQVPPITPSTSISPYIFSSSFTHHSHIVSPIILSLPFVHPPPPDSPFIFPSTSLSLSLTHASPVPSPPSLAFSSPQPTSTPCNSALFFHQAR